MKRLGVLGTLVWDRLWRPEAIRRGRAPLEDWGGIAYSWSAVAAALRPGWEAVPLVKVGSDLHAQALQLVAGLPGMRSGAGTLEVAERTHRVELHYTTESARTERLTGSVRSWRWEELEPLVRDLDALYLNFISGFEMELPDVEALRENFRGPMYADLHSLFLDRLSDGQRVPRSLPEWRRWVACFDGIQVNEAELRCLAGNGPDPVAFARAALPELLGLVVITLGRAGVIYLADPRLPDDPSEWRTWRVGDRSGGFRCESLPPAPGPRTGDPTGCGDVWGGAFIASLVGGDGMTGAVARANVAAAVKLQASGASGLYERLRTALEAGEARAS